MTHILAAFAGVGVTILVAQFGVEMAIAQCETTHPKCEYVGMAVPVEEEEE